MPPGAYRAGTNITCALQGGGGLDPHDPEVPRRYFYQLFSTLETDRENIQELRLAFNYPEVERRFHMIEEATTTVTVTNYGTDEERRQVREWVEALRWGSPRARHLLRCLQPYLVSVSRHAAEEYRRRGLLMEILPGVEEWLGPYDPVRGLGGGKPKR